MVGPSRAAGRALRILFAVVLAIQAGASVIALAAQDALVPPELIQGAEPEYPAALRDRGVAGAVVVELTVGVDGRVTQPVVVLSAGPEFDAAALQASRRLVFSPATEQGKPMPVRIRYRFVFQPDMGDVRRGRAASEGRYDRRDLEPTPGGFCSLQGVLLEKGSGRPIVGAVLMLDARVGNPPVAEALTDDRGAFRFGLLAPGAHTLALAAGEHRAVQQVVQIAAGRTTHVDLRAEREHYGLYRATAEAPARPGESVRREMTAEEIQRVPGVYGDTLKVVQNLPGVARPSPFGGEVVVRGSAPADTLAAIEGVPIPIAYHFGGLYSVVNTDMLDGIDFLPGGYSVLWGRQVGGIVNARLRQASAQDGWAGYVEANVFHAGFFLRGNLGEHTQFSVAARRSYIDVLLSALIPADALGFTTAPRYYDWQAKLDHAFGARTSATVFAYGSDDQLAIVSKEPAGTEVRTVGQIKFGTTFYGLTGILRHDGGWWTSKTTLGLVYGKVGAAVGSLLHFDATTLPVALRQDLTWGSGPVQIRAGIDTQHIPLWADVYAPSGQVSQEGPGGQSQAPQTNFTYHGRFAFHAPGAWWDAVLRLRPDLEVVPGLRFDLFRGVDSDTTLLPRLMTRYKWNRALTLKFAVGTYSQRPQPQEVLSFGGLGNPNLLSMRALDVSLGAEWRPSPSDSLDVQLFYKSLWNVVIQTPGLFPSPPYVNDGKGRVVGLELLARHKLSANWFGWVAYTLLKADRQDAPGGQWRPFDYDQRHILTAVASYRLPRHWEVSARFRLVTGNPTTPITTAAYDASRDEYQAVAGAYNSDRLPAFHQLDVRVDKRWVFDRWMFNLYLDIQNVYNHRNPEGVAWSYDYSHSALQGGLPIIPSLGVRGEF